MHTGVLQQGDGLTISSTQLPASPFFMRVVLAVYATAVPYRGDGEGALILGITNFPEP